MELLAALGQWIIEKLIWLRDNPEVTWSGAGLTALAVLYFLITKLFAPLFHKKSIPSVSNTFTNSGGGEQNIAQGNRPIAKQINLNAEQISSPQQKATGDRNVFSQNGDVHYKEEHHHYARTDQGIPLQRPKQAEYLVGREELLHDVLAALWPGKAVTLCGSGGIGKTALASRVAWELSPDGKPPARFPDGLLFYSFYGRKDVSLAYDHLVRSYADDAPDNGPETVCRLLANKQALIILDGAEEADDLPAVLRCCGGCGVLITSRKRSDAPDSLLKVKRLDKLPAAEAFRLYSGTAADKATVQAICQQLGGWPLALRLAGQYLRNTGESAADYLHWLDKQPFRKLDTGEHQDKNAALLLERSVEQVSWKGQLALYIIGTLAFATFTERPVVAYLKNFNYSTPSEFCKWVKRWFAHRRTWLLHYTDDDVLFCKDVLNELVIFGLLEPKGEGWQVSHALVHTYARTKMPLSRFRIKELAGFYIAFVREQSAAGPKGYTRLDEEREHWLRVIEACLDSRLWREVQELVEAMQDYLDRQGYWTDDLAAKSMQLTAARQMGDRRNEGLCLNNLGYTYQRRGELDQAMHWYEQCLPLWRELEDRQGEGETLNNMAAIYQQQGRYDKALKQYEQSLSIRQEVGDRKGEGRTLNNIGQLYQCQGDYEQSLPYYEQCLPIAREVRDKIGEGHTLNNIAEIYRAQGEYSKAIEYSEQALAIQREQGDRAGEAESCWNIGLTYRDMGDLAQAEECMVLAVEIKEAIGTPDAEECRDGLEQVRAERRGV